MNTARVFQITLNADGKIHVRQVFQYTSECSIGQYSTFCVLVDELVSF